MKIRIISVGLLLIVTLGLVNGFGLTVFADEIDFKLGRVTSNTLHVRAGPGVEHEVIRTLAKDEVVSVIGFGYGHGDNPHNDLWLQIAPREYIYSSYVQPVKNEPNREIYFNHGEYGAFFVVTIPVVAVHKAAALNSEIRTDYPIVYGTVHKVVKTVKDPTLPIYWYQIYDVQFPYEQVYVQTRALRKISEDFIKPIHPEIPASEKKIEFDLKTRVFTAFEGEKVVYFGKFSYGIGELTPTGTFKVKYKRLLSDMRGVNYLLPGVPAVVYFTNKGASTHGTTWHNDWQVQRSHGCINLTLEDAWWIFRWLPPYFSLDDFAKAKYGAVWSNQPAGRIIIHD